MALSTAVVSATTRLFISPNLPATTDAAGYAAVTGWIPVGEVSNIGQLGGKTTVVKHIPIDTATVVKRSGSVDYGTLNLQGARHAGADSTALQTAFDTRASYSFKIVYPTALGQTDYFTAITTSVMTNIATADSILGFATDLEIDSIIVTAAT